MPEEEKTDFPVDQLPVTPEEDIWYRSEMYKVLDKIIEDPVAEEKLKDFPLWAGSTKTSKLTFFTDRDVQIQENLWDAETCKYLRSLPPWKHTSEVYLKLGQARMIFQSNIRRSLGTPIQKINERVAILSQWKIQTPMEAAPQQKPGLWRRVFG